MLSFLHSFFPEPILLSFGPINIYWYGLLIVIGILSALAITIKLAGYYKIRQDTVFDLAFWLILSGILGARIYHVILEFSYYSNNPLAIIKIWQGGLAIHGAIFAGLIALWFYSKKLSKDNKSTTTENFWLLSSIIVPGLALAQAIGRWGNYFNQENFGKPTDLPWGIPIDFINRPREFLSFTYFHPTYLYESIGNFLIFVILVLFHYLIINKIRNKKPDILIRCHVLGVTCYAVLYSILRFALEFIRIDQTPTFYSLRFPQIISIIIIAVSLIVGIKMINNNRETNIGHSCLS